ncbi:hypothetical protein CYMTET_32018, partial [Cymbomonas tetramitiformis]
MRSGTYRPLDDNERVPPGSLLEKHMLDQCRDNFIKEQQPSGSFNAGARIPEQPHWATNRPVNSPNNLPQWALQRQELAAQRQVLQQARQDSSLMHAREFQARGLETPDRELGLYSAAHTPQARTNQTLTDVSGGSPAVSIGGLNPQLPQWAYKMQASPMDDFINGRSSDSAASQREDPQVPARRDPTPSALAQTHQPVLVAGSHEYRKPQQTSLISGSREFPMGALQKPQRQHVYEQWLTQLTNPGDWNRSPNTALKEMADACRESVMRAELFAMLLHNEKPLLSFMELCDSERLEEARAAVHAVHNLIDPESADAATMCGLFLIPA